MQTIITLLEADTPDLLRRCLDVRREVFTGEMGVPPKWNGTAGTVWTAKAGTASSPGTARTSARCAVCPRRTAPCGSSGSVSAGTAGARVPDARPSGLWRTGSVPRGFRLWCWTPNALPGASMRPAAMRRCPECSWRPECPMWPCAVRSKLSCSAKKSLSPHAGVRALCLFMPRGAAAVPAGTAAAGR